MLNTLMLLFMQEYFGKSHVSLAYIVNEN